MVEEVIDLTEGDWSRARKSFHVLDDGLPSTSESPAVTPVEGRPWYTDPDRNHPFELILKGKPEGSVSKVTFTQVVFFPWDSTFPLTNLWDDDPYIDREEAKKVWETTLGKWSHCVAMCGRKHVRIVQISPSKGQASVVFQIKLPPGPQHYIRHLTWALDPWTLHPLLIFVHSSVLHVFDLELRESLGWLKGHGGNVTSIGVNNHYPHLVYSTSRDCTIRIYDFRWTPKLWSRHLISTKSRNVLDPFGIQNLTEDSRLGRCVIVLSGGRSGGHEAATLGADFHPSLPLIATCGMDHAIRIWYLNAVLFQKSSFMDELTAKTFREDKPLFSCTILHDGRVLSVHWLSNDVLVSNSAAPYQMAENDQSNFGKMVVWKWLSINRFFPSGEKKIPIPVLRGCISDYRESASSKLISIIKLAKDAPRLQISRNSSRPPLIFIPHHNQIIITNPCHFPVRPRSLLLHYQNLRPSDWCTEIPEVKGWTIGSRNIKDGDMLACSMSSNGMIIVGVGKNEALWIWTGKHRSYNRK